MRDFTLLVRFGTRTWYDMRGLFSIINQKYKNQKLIEKYERDYQNVIKQAREKVSPRAKGDL